MHTEFVLTHKQKPCKRDADAAKAHLRLPIDECPQIPGEVGVPDVQVVRRHVQLPVSEAEELQLSQADLQSVPPVRQDLHGNIQCWGDLCCGLDSLR